jgi:hypothetical protein
MRFDLAAKGVVHSGGRLSGKTILSTTDVLHVQLVDIVAQLRYANESV